MKYDIFISYSRRDSQKVDEFMAILEQEKFSIWIDRDGIESGDAFKREILRAIKDSAVVLFFSSESSNQSEWTAKEVGIAVKYKKHIIPILLDESNFNEEIEFDMINLDYIDYTDDLTQAKMREKLLKTLRNKLNKDQHNEKMETESIAQSEEQKMVSVTKIPQGFSFVVNGVQFNMLLVEGSTFWMGANDGSEGINNSKIVSNVSNDDREAEDDEKPVHSVTLSSFYMGETEVTQALWMAVMGVEPAFDGGWTDEEGRGSNYPAYNVSWNDIQDFILKLNNLTGRHFRLPMEAEWEYAARGGKKSSGFKYAGSNNLGRVAWYDVNSVNMAHVVKTKLPNELGLYDMSGNLWEWCGDWYGDYTIVSQVDPRGASDGSVRVLRGGSWDCDAEECRVSYRNYDAPDLREYSNGFRLALSM